MEFKDRSWFLTCFTRGTAKEVNYFWRKLARKPKHDTNKNYKFRMRKIYVLGEERVLEDIEILKCIPKASILRKISTENFCYNKFSKNATVCFKN